ncbi:MAG: transposase [Pseudomonadota bacterium]
MEVSVGQPFQNPVVRLPGPGGLGAQEAEVALSDQGMEDALADRISLCRFAGFSMDHESPDASTICRFRNHLGERGLLAKLLNMINEQLERHGILVRTGSIVDATLIPWARRPRKVEEVIPDELASEDDDDDSEVDHPTGYTVETTYSDYHDARWTRKGKVYCYGYKGHMSVDTGHGFIPGGHATAANRPDCLELMNVVGESGLEEAPRSSRTKATPAPTTAVTWRKLAFSTASCTRAQATVRWAGPRRS